jgi:general secretion pathway protein G
MHVRGFTLIEMLVTVTIVGLLAAMAMPLAQLMAQREKEGELHQALHTLRRAIDAYKEAADTGRIKFEAGTSGYPPSLRVLVDGVEDVQSPTKATIYFLRQMPRDPFYPDTSVAPADTWGLRSYQSPPTAPEPGDDVFDVYSLARGKGLNGIVYRDW